VANFRDNGPGSYEPIFDLRKKGKDQMMEIVSFVKKSDERSSINENVFH